MALKLYCLPIDLFVYIIIIMWIVNFIKLIVNFMKWIVICTMYG